MLWFLFLFNFLAFPFSFFFLDDHLFLSDSFMFEWIFFPVLSFPVQNWVLQWYFSYLISKKYWEHCRCNLQAIGYQRQKKGLHLRIGKTKQSYDQELCCADLNWNQQWIKCLCQHWKMPFNFKINMSKGIPLKDILV